MTTGTPFTSRDLEWLQSRGMDSSEAMRHLKCFSEGPRYIRLNRPAVPGDGIEIVEEEQAERYLQRHAEAALEGRLMVFVPASGAASRMFADLIREYQGEPMDEEERKRCDRFFRELPRFPFYPHLVSALNRDGLSPERSDRKTILSYLLTEKGLNYAATPKAFIPFHDYGTQCRTPFEEHLVEAARYVRDREHRCRLHFTFGPEHLDRARRFYDTVREQYARWLNVSFLVDLSAQDPSTDTLAAGPDNRPFRCRDGSLLLRPGGHGSLLRNLEATKGDIVFIKNIDNVVPDRMKDETARYKKILCGIFLEIEEALREGWHALKKTPPESLVERPVFRFLHERLHFRIPGAWKSMNREEKARFLREWLDRPLRVCGVVENRGEPGGGPFWVENGSHGVTLQIVEGAQVDPEDPDQARIWRSATHFNPVDLACGLRNAEEKPFELDRFVDSDTYFITQKEHEGKPFKALERPGLWNGAMARWHTVFVEVPLHTFNPVKRVVDLLRETHRT